MIDPVKNAQEMTGFSLPSFLQMLEQERSNCTLTVVAGGKCGAFFFKEGRLIDAEYENKAGLGAVYALLAMKKPSFSISHSQDRMERITQPLARILLHSDDQEHNDVGKIISNEAAISAAVKDVPLFKKLVAKIVDIPTVKHYYLLDRKGKTIVRSSENQQLCNFIFYSIMSSLQMRKTLEVRGPRSIQIVMQEDEVLLILPGAGIIIGLLINEQACISDITTKIRTALRSPARKEK